MDTKSMIRDFYAALSEGRLDVIEEVVAEDFIEHEALPDIDDGRDGLRQLFQSMHQAFADFSITIEQMVAEGDKVFALVTMQGIHRAEFMGIPSKGKPMMVPVADVMRIDGGRIVEHWGVMDSGVLMQQLL
ncbi:MAG: ester cyclase [Vicinamibacterales bacterium]